MTTPTADTGIVAAVKADYSWIIHHLILLTITGVLVLGGIYGVESLVAKHDADTASKYTAVLAAQTQQNQSVEAQITAQEAHFQEIEKALLAQNAQLSKTIVEENASIAKQRQTDATLTAQQTADRISQQVKATPGEITASGNNVIADLPSARSIASNLDLLSGVQSDLVSTQTQLVNETTIDTNDKATIGQQTTLIAGLKSENVDEVKSCSAQIAVIKSTARKNTIKTFLKGYVVGFVSGVLAKRLIFGKW